MNERAYMRMRKPSFINIMYISSENGHDGTARHSRLVLINMSMHVCCDQSFSITGHIAFVIIMHCATNECIASHFPHLLRVICNNVLDSIFAAVFVFHYLYVRLFHLHRPADRRWWMVASSLFTRTSFVILFLFSEFRAKLQHTVYFLIATISWYHQQFPFSMLKQNNVINFKSIH